MMERLRKYEVGDKVRLLEGKVDYFNSSKTLVRAANERLICTIFSVDAKHDLYIVSVPASTTRQPFFKAYVCGEELVPVPEHEIPKGEDNEQ